MISESLFNKSITTIIASIYFSPAVPTHTSIPAPSEVVDFSGIMPNPTYAKVQEGAALAKARSVDFILAVGGGSGFSRTIQTIEELQPGATVIEDGLSISRNSVADAQSDVVQWVAELGY